MAKFNTSQVFIIASAAFLGGLVVSLFSSPKSGSETRKWISESSENLQNKVKTKSKGLRNNNIPDLYKATEDLGLTEEDLISK